jgi:ubiquinone/menaquinone biosynthesis C-methylase UbiE
MQLPESDSMQSASGNSSEESLRDKYDWAGNPSTNAEEVMRQYDEFAPTYDETLLSKWGYQAPAEAAAILTRHIKLGSVVLDAGCGTGLTGSELHRVGFDSVHGIDISTPSLQIAASKSVYRSLVRADLLKPLPFPSDTFDAAICVGVLSYISGEELFRELCRVTRNSGVILLSHRTDLIAARSFADLLRRLETAGLWSPLAQSGHLPYLPRHPDFGEKIHVQYFVLRVEKPD